MLTFGLASSLRQKLTVEVSDRTADQFTRPNVMYIILTRMQQFGRCYGNNSYAQCSCTVTVSLGSSVTAMPQSNIVPDLIQFETQLDDTLSGHLSRRQATPPTTRWRCQWRDHHNSHAPAGVPPVNTFQPWQALWSHLEG